MEGVYWEESLLGGVYLEQTSRVSKDDSNAHGSPEPVTLPSPRITTGSAHAGASHRASTGKRC